MAFTREYEITTPAGTEAASLGDNRIRNLKIDLEERLEDMLYGFNADEGSGNEDLYGVKKLRFRELAADPTILVAGDDFFLYTKNVSDISELFFRDNTDTVRQITNDGKLNVVAGDYAADSIDEDDIQLANNAALTAKNQAGDGTVDLIKAGTNDLPTLPDSAEMASNAAPVEAEAIANKKYVDDQDKDIYGAGVSKSVSTNYTALTSGILVVQVSISGWTGGQDRYATIKSDDNATPSTVVAKAGRKDEATYTRGSIYQTMTMPILKDKKYRVDITSGVSTSIMFYPTQ